MLLDVLLPYARGIAFLVGFGCVAFMVVICLLEARTAKLNREADSRNDLKELAHLQARKEAMDWLRSERAKKQEAEARSS